MKYLVRNKLLILILLIMALLFPTTISLPQQSRSENIVTAVGIDKVGDEYELTIQYLIPDSSTGQDALKCSSIKEKTVGNAIEKINLDFGKISSFAHCRVIVLNDEACKQNMSESLDYLLRNKTNTNNIILVNTKESAKDLLTSVDNLNSEFYVVLSRYIVEDKHNQYQDLKTIGDFYNAILSPNKCVAITNIDVEQSSTSSGESSGGESGTSSNEEKGSSGSAKSQNSGGSNSSSEDTSEQKIKNDGKLAIIKDNKLITTLSSEESKNIDWFNPKVKDLTLILNSFTDEVFKEAKITFDVFKKNSHIFVDFVNGVPKYTLEINANVSILEATTSGTNADEYKINNKIFSNKLKEYIKQEIINQLKSAEKNFKQKNFDIVMCYENFNKFKTKEFNNYLKKIENKDDYIKNVIFEYDVKINQWNK